MRWSLLCLACLLACESAPAGKADRARAEPAPSPKKQAPKADFKPTFVRGPEGSAGIARWIKTQRQEVVAQNGQVLVYVGAAWCEPCQVFKNSVKKGELDDELAGVRFLEFDLDTDKPALQAAGYGTRMIPLLALPDEEGRGTDQRIIGSIKGPGATKNIMGRLRARGILKP